MKTQSSSLVHKINNHLGVLLSSLEALEGNLDDHEYLKEMLSSIILEKDVCKQTLDEVKAKLREVEA